MTVVEIGRVYGLLQHTGLVELLFLGNGLIQLLVLKEVGHTAVDIVVETLGRVLPTVHSNGTLALVFAEG